MAHLIFQTAYPGDVFLTIPLLKGLRSWEPQAQLVLACRPGLGEFFLNANLVDDVIEVDKRTGHGRAQAQALLAAKHWDIIFAPHTSVRTALWVWRLKAKRGKVSFRQWWNFPFYSRRVTRPQDLPDALRQLSLLTPYDENLAERFGAEVDPVRNSQLQKTLEDFGNQPIPAWASMQVRAWKPEGRKVFLAPGSVWATKRWTRDGYMRLARLLINKNYEVELVGSPTEYELCESIAREIPGVFNRAGQTSLASLGERLAHGSLLVCNDSGAMHVAASSGLPTVAIFGPTVLAQGFRPWQTQALVVQQDLPCRPCGKHGASQCPLGTHECMVKISVEDVYKAVQRFITET